MDGFLRSVDLNLDQLEVKRDGNVDKYFASIEKPGRICTKIIAEALEKLQFKNKMVWHKDNELPKSDLIVIPGGFSYGDYLRSGAIAGKSLIINEVIKAANDGCLILGICNGFQILTEAGLLPGSLIRNKKLLFTCRETTIEIQETIQSPFLSGFNEGELLNIPVAHNEGNFFCSTDQMKRINDNNQIAALYCNKDGEVNEKSNPNGAMNNIAGIFNKEKNILGMMPHPERMIDKYLSGDDGSIFFQNLLSNLK